MPVNIKVNLKLYSQPYTKISLWITELTIKCKTIKLLEETIGGNLCELELGGVL